MEPEERQPSYDEAFGVFIQRIITKPLDKITHIRLPVGLPYIHSVFCKMKSLTQLTISNGHIREIKNLHCATSLQYLNLSHNLIQDLSPLIHNTCLEVLILDHCPIKYLYPHVFQHLKNIKHLSLIGTRISSLWLTVGALKQLPNLRRLDFALESGELLSLSQLRTFNVTDESTDDEDEVRALENISQNDDQESQPPNNQQDTTNYHNLVADIHQDLERMARIKSHSFICLQNHYRDFIISNLPRLDTLDGKFITEEERKLARVTYDQQFVTCNNFSYFCKNFSQNILHQISRFQHGISNHYRHPVTSIAAHQLKNEIYGSLLNVFERPEKTKLSKEDPPRQFEYNSEIPGLMVFGALNGKIVVLNHQTGVIVSQCYGCDSESTRPEIALGLCWLHGIHSHKFIAGTDKGTIRLYDTNNMDLTNKKCYIHNYSPFPNLTSVNINCTDQHFLTSGYPTDICLYDIHTNQLVRNFSGFHSNHVNVLKFSHFNPHLFATSSFDGFVKLWDLRDCEVRPIFSVKSENPTVMVCWSPDDKYLLASAVDNEVKQYNSNDGSINLQFPIRQLSSQYNYTRSYYMNSGDYVIIGSCEQPAVSIFSSKTGQFLMDVDLEETVLGNSDNDLIQLYCQSLRGDPHNDFQFTALVAYEELFTRVTEMQLLRVNLLKKQNAG